METSALVYYIILAALSFISTCLNALLLAMFLSNRRRLLCLVNNKILMTMLIAGLCIGLTGVVNWCLLAAGQDIYRFIGIIPMFASILASTLMLCLLTLSQLLTILYPLRHASLMTDRRTNIATIFSFVLAGVYACNQIIIHDYYGSVVELQVRTIIVAIVFLLGTIMLVTGNYKLYRAIQDQRKRLLPLMNISLQTLENLPPSQVVATEQAKIMSRNMHNKVKLKRGNMCILVVVVYIITWFPLTAYYMSALTGRDEPIPWLRRVCMTVATLHPIFNSFLYLLKRKDFRSKLKDMISRTSVSRRENTVSVI
eukprot:Seg1053.5 transcript_id=Seg1053.5/GoldUCD/mRNA.D3Y31 product="hypothetical protein" protein_id=Seg1053.5/GoldUCD/D3Y31